jgi:hypothetical protein
MFETEWERPITAEDEDICPECGADANAAEGCYPGCPLAAEEAA